MKEHNEFNQELGQLISGWSGAKKPALSVFHGVYCDLEPIAVRKDLDVLFGNLSLDNQGESWTYLPYGPFANVEEFLDWAKTTDSRPDTQLYTIINKENLPVGIAGYLRMDPHHGSIEVGHLHFSKLLQKTPMATEAMYLMMRYAFDELGYRRYEWKCNALNEPSKAAALRYGFSYEGLFRQSNIFKGRNRDTAWFSIIDKEWPAIKNKMQKWLDPNNFDNAGRQIKRLQEM